MNKYLSILSEQTCEQEHLQCKLLQHNKNAQWLQKIYVCVSCRDRIKFKARCEKLEKSTNNTNLCYMRLGMLKHTFLIVASLWSYKSCC